MTLRLPPASTLPARSVIVDTESEKKLSWESYCIHGDSCSSRLMSRSIRHPRPVRCQAAAGSDEQRCSALRVTRRVAVVQHQRVAVGIREERHVADAGVEDVAVEGDAALL